MTYRYLLALVLSAGLLAGCKPPLAPDNTLVFTNGDRHTLADFHGQWVLINYWAEWCKPCLKEIPHFNRLVDEYPGKVVVLGTDFDNAQGEALAARIARMGIRFTVLAKDPSPVLGQARPAVLPTTLVYGPDGTLQQMLQGDQTFESLRQAVHLP